jgi:hypothetical protein
MLLRSIAAIMLAAAPCSAWCQSSALPALGIRVRLTARDTIPVQFGSRDRVVGTLTAAGRDSVSILDLDRGRVVTVPITSLGRVEVSEGRHSGAGRGALLGLLAGAGAGIASGLVACGGGACSSSGGDFGSAVVLVLGAGGALGGAGVGALIGAMVRTERWRDVEVSPRHSLGLSVRF